MNHQRGYALYLVLAVSAILFLLLSMVAASLKSQREALTDREAVIRANNLILSGLVLWLAREEIDQEKNEWELFYLPDGRVEVRLVDVNEEQVVIKVLAELHGSDVNREVEVILHRQSGQILQWRTG